MSKNIAISISNKRDQNLLKDILKKWNYKPNIIEFSDFATNLEKKYDLYIIDKKALARNRKEIKIIKTGSDTFLPFLLLTAGSETNYHKNNIWKLIDEFISTPIKKEILNARIRILLRARKFSEEMRERYFTLVEQSPVGIAIIKDRRIVYTNPRLLEISGYQENKLIDKQLADLIDTEYREKYYKTVLSNEEGSRENIECKLSTNSDSQWVELSAQRIKYKGDKASLVIISDITKQKIKKQNEYLKHKEQEYEKIFNASEDAMIMIKDSKLYLVNQAFTNLTGYNKKSLLGKSIDQIPIFGELEQNLMDIQLDDENEIEFESKIKTYGASIRYIKFHLIKINIDWETAYILILRDFTEQVELIQKLERIKETEEDTEGMVKICSNCKRVKDEQNDEEKWIEPEKYVTEYLADIKFSHGVCPECTKELYPDYNKKRAENKEE